MSSPTLSSLTAVPLSNPRQPKRIPAQLSTAAQVAWWVVFAMVLLMNLLAIDPMFRALQRECVSQDCLETQLGLFLLRSWLALGLSRELYAATTVAVNLLPTIVYMLVGLILFRAKPTERMVYFTSLTMVLFGGVTYTGNMSVLAREVQPLWWYPVIALDYLGSIGIVAFFFLFPNGEFVPRWIKFFLALYAIEQFLEILNNPPVNWRFLPNFVVDGFFLLSVASAVFSQIYRYRRVSNPTERRQTKWVVFGTSVALVGLVSSALIFVSTPPLYENVLAEVGLTLLFSLLISAIPLSIAIAMLRARLWDIDLIVNRTIVYGAMTAIIAGLLAVLSDLARGLLLGLTGKASELGPIVATLIIVALFEPIRKRVQEFVDRHFKYATGTFGAFGEELSKFVQLNDPEELARRFLQEAIKTFDARGGAIFLGRDSGLTLVSSAGEWDGKAALSTPLEHAGSKVGLVALGSSSKGEGYDDEDKASLEKMSVLVAHAIQLTVDPGPPQRSAPSGS